MLVRRDSSFGANDIHLSYRPYLVDEMLGNDVNRNIVKNYLESKKVPHTQLFIGDPGCGKTTMARIVSLGLNCEKNGVGPNPCLQCGACKSIMSESNLDVKEINVGQTGGKDYVSAIVNDLPFAPFYARHKVIIFDEAHMLTDAAKNLLLKPTEGKYKHVYFMFCTNHPEKLMTKKRGSEEEDAFLSRCSVLKFGKLEKNLVEQLLTNVCEFEGIDYKSEVIKLITEECKGVPRTALILLSKICAEGSWGCKYRKQPVWFNFRRRHRRHYKLIQGIKFRRF
jgi:DNA polymerase III subunit gamma/tau